MFKVDLGRAVCDIRRHVCPASGPDADLWFRGVLFETYVWLSDSRPAGRERRAQVRFLLCGRTTVFADVDLHVDPLDLSRCKYWTHLTNHDDCYPHSIQRVLSDLYFEMADEIAPDLPPAALQDLSCLNFLGRPWRLVRCRMALDESDPNHYHRVLTEVQPWE